VAGRTLLLHAEGGLGNAIQFVRYAPHLARRLSTGGTRVLVECHAALKPLMLSLQGVAGVCAFGQELPPFDRFAPLASLPLILRHTGHALPNVAVFSTSPPPPLRVLSASKELP
jgi:hypothetical protein